MNEEVKNQEGDPSKIRDILVSLFFENQGIDECHIRSGKHVYYALGGQLQKYELEKAYISSNDIYAFQLMVIQAKTDRADIMTDIDNSLNKEGGVVLSYNLKSNEKLKSINIRITRTMSYGEDHLSIRKVMDNIPTPEEIGLPQILGDLMKDYKKGGLIIFTAPMFNGKTTSITSLCNDFFSKNCVKVITLEDPIEFYYSNDILSFVEQREKGFHFDDYKSGIKSALTQSPNFVILQELREPDTIKELLYLTEKGALTLATMHTQDATSAITAILEKYPEAERSSVRQQLSSQVRAIVSQRLVPTKKDPNKRVAVFEVLINTPEFRGYLKGSNESNLGQILERAPHIPFDTDFFNKVKGGIITPEVAIEYCPASRVSYLKTRLNELEE